MTGPEHYREAERLIALTTESDRTPESDPQPDEWILRATIDLAQVHATLAVAAATMQAVVINGEQANAHEWAEATS